MLQSGHIKSSEPTIFLPLSKYVRSVEMQLAKTKENELFRENKIRRNYNGKPDKGRLLNYVTL